MVLLVSLIYFGLEVARARAIRLGLDIKDIVDGGLFIVDGFVVVILYMFLHISRDIDEQGWIVRPKYGLDSRAMVGPVIGEPSCGLMAASKAFLASC